MMAGETKAPFSDEDWVFEIKWDGYRAIADCRKKDSSLYSRNAISFAEKYPLLFKEMKQISTPMILDGEIVVLNEKGKPDFQQLQSYNPDDGLSLVYYVFDILNYKGKDVTDKTLLERKTLLQKVLPKSDSIVYCDHVENDGEDFFREMIKQNLEGMIAKRKDSLYKPGDRSKNWLKIKHQLIDEAIIAGFTKPEGSRNYFGSLVLGQYKGSKLIYVGHTGTGFNTNTLKELHNKMQPHISDTNPFKTKIPVNNTVTWLEPKLVANIHYSELTNNGVMRHPVFHGLRIDKTVTDMKKEASPEKKIVTKKAVVAKEKDKPDSIKADGSNLSFTNTNKVFWPEDGITKGDLIAYYNAVYPYIIPYLKNRPQSMRRNPNGITDAGFFQKNVGESSPNWLKTITLYSESANRDIEYLLCNDKATLLYMANLGCIELNPWNSTTKYPDNPDYLVLDLDPSDKNSFSDVIEVALLVKDLLDKAGTDCYCKTSGATGLHIYVPLGGKYSYDEARLFAELVAHRIVEKAPELTSIERTIKNRKYKLYVDYLQNKRGQTLASAYSVRPKPGATVSTPLDWKEVKKGLLPQQFTIQNTVKRLEKKGDLFQPVLGKGINMKACLKKLEKL